MKPLWVLILTAFPVLAGSDAPAGAAGKAACGPKDVKFSVKANKSPQPAPRVEPGKALVYVVEQYDRPGNEWGKPTIRVGLDGTWVGANRSTSYLFFSVEPGEHHLCSDWQSLPPWLNVLPAATGFTAESAQTYYFRARVTEHHEYFTLDLEPVNRDEGKLLVDTVPRSEYRRK